MEPSGPASPMTPGRLRLLARLVAAEFAGPPFRGAERLLRHGIGIPWTAAMWARWQVEGITGASAPLYSSRLTLLDTAARTAPREGEWFEFGVYRGESLRLLAGISPGRVYGFDSFEGLPERWTHDMGKGHFSTDGELPAVPPNVVLVKGWFSETVPAFLVEHPGATVGFLHIDCDLYRSARAVLQALRGRVRAGTVVVFDEYTGPYPDDESRAFREFLRSERLAARPLGCSGTGSVAFRLQPARA